MKNQHIFIIHLVFWFIVLSLNFSFLIFRSASVPPENYIYISVKSLVEAGVFYIFYLVIVPKCFSSKNLFRFLIITLAYAVLYIPFYAAVITYTDIVLGIMKNWDSFNFKLIVATYYVILYIILGGLLKLALDGIISHQQKLQLEQQNIKSELALLRSQINPHFLFNSLNTIHSYVNFQHDKASHSIILLSDIMRYMLYETVKEKITLKQEIDYLKSYIELQGFRLEKKGFVEFKVTGLSDKIIIPPMLLTPFVENAFKHGKKRGKEKGIEIDLKIHDDRELEFYISNDIEDVKSREVRNENGVGLKNVKRRLELLYPDKHKLHIYEKDDKFIVELKIDLS